MTLYIKCPSQLLWWDASNPVGSQGLTSFASTSMGCNSVLSAFTALKRAGHFMSADPLEFLLQTFCRINSEQRVELYSWKHAHRKRSHKHKTHPELIAFLGHHFGVWDSLTRKWRGPHPSPGPFPLVTLMSESCPGSSLPSLNSSRKLLTFVTCLRSRHPWDCRCSGLSGLACYGTFVVWWFLPSDSCQGSWLNGNVSAFSCLTEHDLHCEYIHSSRVTYHTHIFQAFIFSYLYISMVILSESPMGSLRGHMYWTNTTDRFSTLGSSVLSPKFTHQSWKLRLPPCS